jgi:hypothetical protein
VRRFFAVIAVVANQAIFAFVKRQGNIAVPAANRFAAAPAQNELRKTAPV